MLTVTENAGGLLKEILSASSDDPALVLRLMPGSEGHMGLMLSEEEPGDQVVKHQGIKVLLVPSELAAAVDGITLDVEDAGDGPKLVVLRYTAE